jgi:putative glutathione S-transferase
MVRALKRLEDVIGVTVVDPLRDERGWRFQPGDPDPHEGCRFLAEAYRATDPGYAGRVSVPVLWDSESRRIVNNESAEIIRMLDAWSDDGPALYPEPLCAEIDEVNQRVYDGVNDGVYRTGFATTQEAYEEAFDALFATLDWLEERLARRRYLVGDALTEADVRLFVTLIRFDAVYVGHFKCNLRRIADYPALSAYLRDLYQHPGVAATVSFDHIKRHYYLTHPALDPSGIVPKGPELDLLAPHGRDAL